MAKASKETLQVVEASMALCSSKPSEDAKSRVLIFQADEVIVDGPIELYLTANQYLDPLTDEQIFEHNGSVKFTIPNQVFASDKCKELRTLKPKGYAIIRYGVAPQSSRIGDSNITYARTKFLAVVPEAPEAGETRRKTTAATAGGTRTPGTAAAGTRGTGGGGES